MILTMEPSQSYDAKANFNVSSGIFSHSMRTRALLQTNLSHKYCLPYSLGEIMANQVVRLASFQK
jgi:hypothetical protein